MARGVIYEDWLKTKRKCPFCSLTKDEAIKGNRSAVMTLAKAPYCKDHLIITCKKHHLRLNLMSTQEKADIEKLIYYGMRKLHEKYKNVTVLYREGNLKEVGKSVEHLHYHLIPEMQIGPNNIHWEKRIIFSEKTYINKIAKFRQRFINNKR